MLTWVVMLLGDRPTLFLGGYFTGETHMSGMCVLPILRVTGLWPHASLLSDPQTMTKMHFSETAHNPVPTVAFGEKTMVLQVKVPSKVGQLTHKGVLPNATLDGSSKMNLNAQKRPSYAISSLWGLGDVTSLLSAYSAIVPKLIILCMSQVALSIQ